MFKVYKPTRKCDNRYLSCVVPQKSAVQIDAGSKQKLNSSSFRNQFSRVNVLSSQSSQTLLNNQKFNTLFKRLSPRNNPYSSHRSLRRNDKPSTVNLCYTSSLTSRKPNLVNSVDRFGVNSQQRQINKDKLRLQFLKEDRKNSSTTEKSKRFRKSIEVYDQNSQFCTIYISLEGKQLCVCFKVKKISSLTDFLKKYLKNHTSKDIVGFQTADGNLQIDYLLTLPEEDGSTWNGKTLKLTPYYQQEQQSINLGSFDIVQSIGSGGFSTVYLCRFKENGKFYAMKVINKSFIVKHQKKKIVMNERNIMITLNGCEFVSKIHFAFESKSHLVFVMDYYEGGELFNLVKRYKKMPEDVARFYITEVLLGLEQIHSNSIVYRDFKPENIMLDLSGHVHIADFGLAKPNITTKEDRAYSFCGSPEYMPPEMILKDGHSLPVDFYCVGALLYELVTGLPPFYDTDPEKIYQATLDDSLYFPDHAVHSDELSDLIEGLLCKDESYRLGSTNGIQEILSHPWFTCSEQSVKKFARKQIQPPVHFRKIQDLIFNYEEMKDQNQELMKDILHHQKAEKNSKYLKVMNGFYYDSRIQICEDKQNDDAGSETISLLRKKKSLQKGVSPSLATQSTKHSDSSFQRHLHQPRKNESTTRLFLECSQRKSTNRSRNEFGYCQSKRSSSGREIQSLEKRLLKSINNLI